MRRRAEAILAENIDDYMNQMNSIDTNLFDILDTLRGLSLDQTLNLGKDSLSSNIHYNISLKRNDGKTIQSLKENEPIIPKKIKKDRKKKRGYINIESVADDPEATKILPPPLHQPPFDANNNAGETIIIPPEEIHTDVQNGSSAESTKEKNKTELTEIDAAGNEIFEKSPESEENQPESGSVKSAKKQKKARKEKTA